MSADLVVRLELATVRADGIEGRRVRHELHGRSVHVAESDVQADVDPVTRTIDVSAWHGALTAACDVQVPGGGPAFPPDGVLLPWDLLVAAGTAVNSRRPGVVEELLARAGPFANAYDALLRATQGRLRVVGTARGRVALLSWVLGSDGWRALTPYVDVGPFGVRAMVRLERREPRDLAREVARWAAVLVR